jgi:hypothetical protein
MAFSLRSLKLYGGPETPKVSEIPENYAEISKIFEKREMLTFSEDSRDFYGVSGLILNLTASFWVRSLWRFFKNSGT